MLHVKGNTLQQSIDKAATGDLTVDLGGQTLWQYGTTIQREGVEVKNGQLVYADAACLVKQGKETKLTDLKIDNRGNNSALPIIELLDVDGTIIRRVEITGNTPRKAVLCRSRASNVLAEDLTISGNIGWGWVYNDGSKEQEKLGNPNFRVVNGVDYTGEPMGSNTTLRRYKFGSPELARSGDASQFNLVECGYTGILIEDSQVDKTVKGDSKGFAFGHANCRDVIIRRIKASNIGFSALHFEKGGGHLVEHFEIFGAERGISLGHTEGSAFRFGQVNEVEQAVTSYNTLSTLEFGPSAGGVFDTIRFDGMNRDGFLLTNLDQYELLNLEFKNYRGLGSPIRLYQQDPDRIRQGVTRSRFYNLRFTKGDTGTNPEYLINTTDSVANEFSHIISEDMSRKINISGNVVTV